MNREEEKQRLIEEKNINDDHRKMLKMAAGLTNKGVAFHGGSPRSSSPSESGDRTAQRDDVHVGVQSGVQFGSPNLGSSSESNLWFPLLG